MTLHTTSTPVGRPAVPLTKSPPIESWGASIAATVGMLIFLAVIVVVF
jgi:hypothetical protein